MAAAPAALAATDSVAKLPISSYSTMVIDSAHERVYLTEDSRGSADGAVQVYDFAGRKVTTLSSSGPVSGMALSEDGGTLYASNYEMIAAYDTQTLARSVYAYTPWYAYCGRQVARSGGKVWYTQNYNTGDCHSYTNSVFGVTGGTAYDTKWSAGGRLQLATGEGAPDRLFMGQPPGGGESDPFLTSFDTGGDTLVRGAARRFADGDGKGALNFKDMSVSADGKLLAVADAGYGTRLLNTLDLSDADGSYGALPAGATASAVAFSGDGTYLARGADAPGSTADLLVQKADPRSTAAPLEFAFEGSLDGNRVAPRGLGWSKDGTRLFAVTTDAAGSQYWLHVIQPPAAQYDSRFTGGLTYSPGRAVVGEPLAVRGRLTLDGTAPVEPVKVSAVRTDADGTHRLAAVEAKADGSFTVLDEPDAVGDATYTVSYLGDLTHRPAEDVSLTVPVAKAPTALTLKAPSEATLDGGVRITGTLTWQGRALEAGASVQVRRTDRLGSGALSSVAVGADGTFTVEDLPRTTRTVTYTVSYAGDALHEGAAASAEVVVRRR
ncbi:Ig-like domain repeat protein [Streptomyces sp. NPDC005907]|uniref:Ig-like domain repeat protein n=1 Tax=Streptomyces sp. NPDC005907 TaxID=3154571 RepID=UPI0033DC3812